jgi:hypothetical protein
MTKSNGRLARSTPAPLSLEMGTTPSSLKGTPQTLKADTSLTLTGTSPLITESSLSFRGRNPIAISDETAQFAFQFTESTSVIHNSTLDEDTHSNLVRSTESSTTIDDALTPPQELLAKLNRMERIVEEKEATIAALNTMLKRQSIIPGTSLHLPSLLLSRY